MGAKALSSKSLYSNKEYSELLKRTREIDVYGQYNGELPSLTASFKHTFQYD